jgi:hypothetical protein
LYPKPSLLSLQVCPASQPGVTNVGSQTTLPVDVQEARQETLGMPLLVSSQHCAAWPSMTVHWAESLHEANVFGGVHDWPPDEHVEEPPPKIAVQHPSPTGQRVAPQATVNTTEDASPPEEASAPEVEESAAGVPESVPGTTTPPASAPVSDAPGGAPPSTGAAASAWVPF